MEWRESPSFPCYEVSEFGDVRRCRKGIRGGIIGKVMKAYVRKDGYRMFILRRDEVSNRPRQSVDARNEGGVALVHEFHHGRQFVAAITAGPADLLGANDLGSCGLGI